MNNDDTYKKIKQRLARQIARTKIRVDELKLLHGDSPCDKYTYYGGWEMGYWSGRLNILEDILDEIERVNIDGNAAERESK